MKLDEKNCIILNLLQEDCRMSLTEIAKRINLSVDSVKKRVAKMKKEGIFYPKIQIRPRQLGFKYVVDVKVKLHNYKEKEMQEFIEYTTNHPRIPEVLSLSGEWDFTLVIIAKDHEELGELTGQIRKKFGNIISDWTESLTTIAYKFEKYDLLKLIGDVNDEKIR